MNKILNSVKIKFKWNYYIKTNILFILNTFHVLLSDILIYFQSLLIYSKLLLL